MIAQRQKEQRLPYRKWHWSSLWEGGWVTGELIKIYLNWAACIRMSQWEVLTANWLQDKIKNTNHETGKWLWSLIAITRLLFALSNPSEENYVTQKPTCSWGSNVIGSTKVSLPRHSATTFLVPSSLLSQWLNNNALLIEKQI